MESLVKPQPSATLRGGKTKSVNGCTTNATAERSSQPKRIVYTRDWNLDVFTGFGSGSGSLKIKK
jgi:hypothetical protein